MSERIVRLIRDENAKMAMVVFIAASLAMAIIAVVQGSALSSAIMS